MRRLGFFVKREKGMGPGSGVPPYIVGTIVFRPVGKSLNFSPGPEGPCHFYRENVIFMLTGVLRFAKDSRRNLKGFITTLAWAAYSAALTML